MNLKNLTSEVIYRLFGKPSLGLASGGPTTRLFASPEILALHTPMPTVFLNFLSEGSIEKILKTGGNPGLNHKPWHFGIQKSPSGKLINLGLP